LKKFEAGDPPLFIFELAVGVVGPVVYCWCCLIVFFNVVLIFVFVFVIEHSNCHDWSVSWFIVALGWMGEAVADSCFLEGYVGIFCPDSFVANNGDCTFVFVWMLPFCI